MLHTVDLTLRLSDEQYRKELPALQLRLRRLAFELYRQQRSLVAVLEGWDAAGKGGAIRRLTEKIDPRGYQVYPIAAPAGDDALHHYLWRFWRRLRSPEDKQIVIFDRSWYGRVLVERVEGFATADEWRRAYREINHFEQQLVDAGMLIVKLFVHIDQDEQERRFAAREETEHKRWKLTEEDWRNREKWHLYEEAVVDMLTRTSTAQAPWTVIEGNDKRWARARILRAIAEHLEEAVPLPADEPEKRGKRRKKAGGKK